MKRSVYLTILTIVTVICIIVGSTVHIVGFGLDLVSNLFQAWDWDWDTDNDDASGGSVSTGDGSGTPGATSSNGCTATRLDATDLESFTGISIDAAVMDLTISPGETYRISWSCQQRRVVPSYEIKDGVLTLSQSGSNLWRGSNNNCHVQLTVPANTLLGSISGDVNVGDINFSQLSIQNLDLTTNVGDFDLGNCSLGNMSIRANVGDLYLKQSSFSNLDVNADVGDVYVESSEDLSNYAIDLSAGAGSVSVNNQDHRRSYAQSGTNGCTVTIQSNVGDVALDF